jgi:uncharacterized LabA/DUF88 family protein
MADARIAVLIDADNSSAASIEAVLGEIASHGGVTVRRAYGNWASPNLKPWTEQLHVHAIQPIQQFALTKGKNASDIALVIDAMDLLHRGVVDGFALVSSDADFTPLVMRLLQEGAKVYGFGERKTPEPFVNACSKFTFVEALVATGSPQAGVKQIQRASQAKLRGDAKLVALLRSAVSAAADEDGWAQLWTVGSHIANQSSFDSRNYGYARLGDLVDATGLFESEQEGNVRYIRDKKSR